MNIQLDDNQTKILQNALEAYISSLREEIVKTEKHEWRVALQQEKKVLSDIQKMLS